MRQTLRERRWLWVWIPALLCPGERCVTELLMKEFLRGSGLDWNTAESEILLGLLPRWDANFGNGWPQRQPHQEDSDLPVGSLSSTSTSRKSAVKLGREPQSGSPRNSKGKCLDYFGQCLCGEVGTERSSRPVAHGCCRLLVPLLHGFLHLLHSTTGLHIQRRTGWTCVHTLGEWCLLSVFTLC